MQDVYNSFFLLPHSTCSRLLGFVDLFLLGIRCFLRATTARHDGLHGGRRVPSFVALKPSEVRLPYLPIITA